MALALLLMATVLLAGQAKIERRDIYKKSEVLSRYRYLNSCMDQARIRQELRREFGLDGSGSGKLIRQEADLLRRPQQLGQLPAKLHLAVPKREPTGLLGVRTTNLDAVPTTRSERPGRYTNGRPITELQSATSALATVPVHITPVATMNGIAECMRILQTGDWRPNPRAKSANSETQSPH